MTAPFDEEERGHIERRAAEAGAARAKFEQMKEEHIEILKFVREYRPILDKLYASKLTEVIVNTGLGVILLAVLSALVALVLKK